MPEREGEPGEIVEDDEIDEIEEIEDELAARPDAPEADVIEQHQSVVPSTPPDIRVAPDVPEADALEQAISVDDGDDFDE